MDGSVVIGIELRDESFTAALTRLRQTAAQTAMQGMSVLISSLNSISSAFARTAVAGSAWSGQLNRAFSQVTSGAAAVGPRLLSAGRAAGNQFFQGILAAGGQNIGQSLAQRILASFSSGGFYRAGSQAGSQVAAGLGSWNSALVSRVRVMAGNAQRAFSGSWYAVGYNMAAGIASGVYGASELIQRAAVDAAKSALYWAKRYLGIRSPSRVFREEVGRMIPAGVAEGITAGVPEAQTALRRQSEKLVRTARQDVTPAISGGASGSRTVQADVGREMKIRLEAPLYLDGRELARATAKYTGQQLVWEAM